VLQDGRYTLRLWARHPLHTVFTIAALAIGIGATTGGFSVVNTLLLSSLPFHEPERLASFHRNEFIPPHASSKQFHDWREQSTYLADAALVEEGDVNIGVAQAAVRVHAASVSWNLFDVLGTPPTLGRTFLPGEDAQNSDQVVIISYGLWQQLFGGDRSAVDSSIRVNGAQLTIIGVTPPSMQLFPGTLNIELDAPFDLPRERTRLEAEEYGGTVSVNIVPCKVLGRAAVILRTDKADSDPQSRKIIEVACEVKLREQHQLRDGDVIEVEVAA
jgi:putative ABC transport system permease protein